MELLSTAFTYKENGDIVKMTGERDRPPFDEYTIGTFVKGDDGYYRFTATNVEPMTCKMLREAAKKAANLNS